MPIVRGLLTGIAIPILNSLHTEIAVRLTKWQQLREDRDHEASIFLKLFFFSFCNTYNNLFLMVIQNGEFTLADIRIQVAVLLVMQLVVGNGKEVSLEYASKTLGKLFRQQTVYSSAHPVSLESSVFDATAVRRLIDQVDDQFARKAQFDIILEIHEAVIFYGMGIMFVAAMPSSILLVVLGGVCEIRVDAYKLLVCQRFPDSRMQVGLGAPHIALTLVTVVACLTNLYMLFYSSSRQQPGSNVSRGSDAAVSILWPNLEEGDKVGPFFCAVNAWILLVYVLSRQSLGSSKLRDEQYRQSYFDCRDQEERRRAEDAERKSGLEV